MSEPTYDAPPPSRPGQIAGIDTKWWIIGGGAAALIVWWAYKRSKNSASGGANTGIDPATGVPYSQEGGYDAIDPNTGIPYSQESGYGTSGYAPVYGGASATPVQTSTQVTVNAAKPATNAEWYFHAVNALAKHGVARAHAQRVLAMYLSMLPLDNEEVGIVEHAVRLIGPPPQNVPIHRVATRSKHRRH